LPRHRARHRAVDVLVCRQRMRYAIGNGFGLGLLRELGWWWSVSVMLARVPDFLREPPVLRGASA
jgi:hypothetical protein